MLNLIKSASADILTYPNPIVANDFATLVGSIAEAVIEIGIPLAVLAIIFAGFRFVIASARGDEAGIRSAKTILWWTIVGTAVVVGAAAIAYAVVNFAKTV